MGKACDISEEKNFPSHVKDACKYHDCGKPFVASFFDSKGNPSNDCHYYKHENVSAYDKRRVDVTVGVAYEADLDETRRTLENASKVEGRLEDEPNAVVLSDLKDSSVEWVVRVWCETSQYFTVRERIVSSIKKNLDGAKIEIPFPQITVSTKK